VLLVLGRDCLCVGAGRLSYGHKLLLAFSSYQG
jgi:hypothetical protein